MADAARAARAAALQEKKRRLEELKARRKSRDSVGVEARTTAKAKASTNLNEYIDGLLKTTTPSRGHEGLLQRGNSSSSIVTTTTQSSIANKSITSEIIPKDTPTEVGVGIGTGIITGTGATNDSTFVIAEAKPPLPAPKKVELFEAATQTLPEDFPVDPEDEKSGERDTDKDKDKSQQSDVPGEISPKANDAGKDGSVQPTILEGDAKQEAVQSDDFGHFLNTASKKIERVLGEPLLADLLLNTIGEDVGQLQDDPNALAKKDGSQFVASKQQFSHDKWTLGRDVTDMDWSPIKRELLVASYNKPNLATAGNVPAGNSNSANANSANSVLMVSISPNDTPSSSLAPRSGELQADGLALVWNLSMPSRPEHIFVCGSPITLVKFHPTEPQLVLGATDSGQVVIWDVRAGRLPVQRSSQGHTHPICGMELIEGGQTLVTAATDGKVNFWSLGNLRDPAESLQLDCNIASLTSLPETQGLLCGDERGTLHMISQRAERKRPVRKLAAGAHFGMVTSITATKVNPGKKAKKRVGTSFALSSGVDWTIKLWSPTTRDQPLLELTSPTYDYYCSVQWNPVHPTLFCTASSNGTLGLWNLGTSMEEMVGEVAIGEGLNKVRWSADGRRMLVACADKVHVLSLSEIVLDRDGNEEERVVQQLKLHGLKL